MGKQDKKRRAPGPPPKALPEPIPDTVEGIVRAVVKKRTRQEREALQKDT